MKVSPKASLRLKLLEMLKKRSFSKSESDSSSPSEKDLNKKGK